MITLGPFDTVEQLVNAAINLVREQGFTVIVDEAEWQTFAELRAELGMAGSTLSKFLRHPECPHFEALRGDSGRILKLKVSDELVTWLRSRRRKNAPKV